MNKKMEKWLKADVGRSVEFAWTRNQEWCCKVRDGNQNSDWWNAMSQWDAFEMAVTEGLEETL